MYRIRFLEYKGVDRNLSWSWHSVSWSQYKSAVLPSFLHTNTTTYTKDCWMVLWLHLPTSHWSVVSPHPAKGAGMHLKCSLKGSLSSISILCFTVLVQPSLFLSSENTSWYPWMRYHAHCANSSSHSFKASKFSSFSTLACLSALVNGFLVMPCSSSNASRVLGQRLVMSILLVVWTHVTLPPLFEVMSEPVIFLSTTGTDLLPLLRSVYMVDISSPFGNLLFLASKEWTKTCNLPPVMMVSVFALTMEVSNGQMVTLSFSFTASSNDLISRGWVVMSVWIWLTLAQ